MEQSKMTWTMLNKVMEVIPIVTGSISFFSSIYLFCRILGVRQRSKKKTRDQLLLGLSSLDVCGSLGLSFSTFAAPVGTEWARGTIETCTLQGFLVQLGLGVPLYNAALCIYFILVVRYNMPDTLLSRWMVPLVHLTVLPYILFTAIYGATTNVFNFSGSNGCWAHNVSEDNCALMPSLCGRGKTANDFSWNFAGYHVILSFVIVVVSMIVLYCTVREIERKSSRWDPSLRTSQLNLTTETTSRRRSITGGDMPSSWLSLNVSARTLSPTPTTHPPQQRPFSLFARKRTLTATTRDTGFYYALSFLLVYTPSFALVLINFDLDSKLYRAVLVLNSIFLPLQGFFNLLIYTATEWRPWVHKQVARLFTRCRSSISNNNDAADDTTPPVEPGPVVLETVRESSRLQNPLNLSVESTV